MTLYYLKTAEMQACETFLDERGRDLAAWAKKTLKGTDEPVPRDVWQELVDKQHEIQSYGKCFRVR